MIFYFSGTGNSLQVAKEISKIQQEPLVSITSEMSKEVEVLEYVLRTDEKVIFVFPIYAWAPPKLVMEFIKKIRLKAYHNQYISCVATCGENIGYTMKLLQKNFQLNGYTLNSGFSIKMPNNYMLIGDVEETENSKKILLNLGEELKPINEVISHQKEDIFQIVEGPMASLLTHVINPFFTKYAMNVKHFNVNDDCIGCKICERVCNGHCIKVEERPTWTSGCTSCLACINYCPKAAINYGKKTQNKGRYTNPNIKSVDMYLNERK